MTSRKLASAVAAASLAGASVVGMAAPALAQTGSTTPVTRGVSDSSITAGETITVNTGSGSFVPGSTVTVTIPGLGISGSVVVDGLGNARFQFKVPAGTAPGNFSVNFAGAPAPVSVPFTVVASAAAGSGTGSTGSGSTGTGTAARASGTSLPRTGADQMVPLAISGLALVGIGAGIVVASRRRREDLPGGIA